MISPPAGESVERSATARQALNQREREAGVAEVRRRLRQQPPHPPRGGPLEPGVSPLRQHDEDRQRILEAHLGQLGGRGLDELQVAGGQCPLKPAVG